MLKLPGCSCLERGRAANTSLQVHFCREVQKVLGSDESFLTSFPLIAACKKQ